MAGFEHDCRDYYPGVNAVTLLAEAESAGTTPAGFESKLEELVPVVRFAVQQRIKAGVRGYWEYASLLELEAHNDDEAGASAALSQALAAHVEQKGEGWMTVTTAKNLRIVQNVLRNRGADAGWLDAVCERLGG